MTTSLGRVIILVDNYEDAFGFYQKNFGCEKIFDATLPDGQRYLHVRFNADDKTGIWFLKADPGQQTSLVGRQTGGQPTLVVYTDNSEELYTQVQNNGVTIMEPLVTAEGSRFFHCHDLYGNRITVVEILS
ncbi:MAG: hypothetical protein QM781_17610 [Chitinophagaceae bacterium]